MSVHIMRSEVWFHDYDMIHENAMTMALAEGKPYYCMGDRPRQQVWFADRDTDPVCRVSDLIDDREEKT